MMISEFEIRQRQPGTYFLPLNFTTSLYLDTGENQVDLYIYISDKEGDRRGNTIYKGDVSGFEKAFNSYLAKSKI